MKDWIRIFSTLEHLNIPEGILSDRILSDMQNAKNGDHFKFTAIYFKKTIVLFFKMAYFHHLENILSLEHAQILTFSNVLIYGSFIAS